MQKREASGFGSAEAAGQVYENVFNLTPGSTTLSGSIEQNFTLPGLLATDRIVAINITTVAQTAGGLAVPGRVTSAGQVAILFVNATTTAIVPAAGLYSVMVYRRT